MANQTDNLLLLPSDGIPRIIDTASDVIQLSVDLQLTGSASLLVAGNLTVLGTTTTTQSETVLFNDNHLYMNNGYTTAVAQTGGLVVNYLPIATTDTVAATGFTAGVAATSNPTVKTTGSATFAVGQFIQISGANNVANNGLYEVLSHVTTTLTIRGIGVTATVEDFTQNQFVTDTTVAGTITRVTVSVIRAGTDGIWETGIGSTTPLTFNDLTTGGSVTLQSAYVNGNTITVTSGEGPLAITLTSDDFTVNGANDVDFGGGVAVSTFNVDTTGALTLDSAAASHLSTTGAGLTLSTITSGTLAVTSAGALNLSGTTGDWQSTGAVTIDSSGGAIGIGTDADAQAINVGTGAAARTITVGNSTGATSVAVNVGTGALNLGTNATAHTTTAGSTTGASATTLQTGTGAMTFTAGGIFDVNATGALTLDSTGGAIGIGTGADAQAINIGTGAAARTITIGNTTGATAVVINSGTAGVDINGPDNTAAAISIDAGGLDYITCDSTDSNEEITLHQRVKLAFGVGADFLVGTGGMTAGDCLTMENGLASRVIKADANASNEEERFVIGICGETTAATGTGFVYTIQGSVIPVTFNAAPATADNGSRVYLSTTAGVATLTAPTSTGTNVFQIGILTGGTGAANPANVILMPQFIARRP